MSRSASVSLQGLHESHVASALAILDLRNIFASRSTCRFINQIVCGGSESFSTKLLFREAMGTYLATAGSDGPLSSFLASQLVQWSRLSRTPVVQTLSLQSPTERGPQLLIQRFMKLESDLARMMTCANLHQTRFSCTAEEKELDDFIACLPRHAEWEDVSYYDVLASSSKQEDNCICQKYSTTVSIKTRRGNVRLTFQAFYELTEVVEERSVHCFVAFPDQVVDSALLSSRAERWIEEDQFSCEDREVSKDAWTKLQRYLFEGSPLPGLSTVVAVFFRLMSSPLVAWKNDSWRTLLHRKHMSGLGRINFEDRPTVHWLREEFSHAAKALGVSTFLGHCPLDELETLDQLARFLA
ncbi:unnamed protein product [Effrenium voratum]|nr:unnamed protein product [Effrenium voratum]|mmetsp:Transcript_119821/g.284706  ORF Transcript_119821/g.284706 Transcript_119821/m.284706 type:complete len:355 (-) Transcript_119821:354-1418(-)